MDNQNNYISLFNESSFFNVDNDTIKINLNNEIYVFKINTEKINGINLTTGRSNYFLAEDGIFHLVDTGGTPISYFNQDVNANNFKIYDLKDATNDKDAMNKQTTITLINNSLTNYYTITQIDTNIYTKIQLYDILLNYVLSSELLNYYTKTQIDTNIYSKSQLDTILLNYVLSSSLLNYYTKTEIDNNIYSKIEIDFNNYTKTEINNLLSNYVEDITLLDYYTKTEVNTIINNYYTKIQVDNLLISYVQTSTLNNYYTKSDIDNDIYKKNYIDNNIYTQTQTNTLLNQYVLLDALNSYYTKNQINNILVDYVLITTLNDYYNKSYIDNNIYTTSQIDTLLLNYVSISALNNYYTKNYIDTNIYTKSQIDTNIYTKSQTDTLLLNFYDKNYIDTNIYLKSYIDNNIYVKLAIDNNFFNKTEINNLLNNYVLTNYLTNNYYTQSLIYTKTESDAKFALITSLNNYVLSSYLILNYYDKTLIYTKTESDALYAQISYIVQNYYSKSQTYSQQEINNILVSYITSTVLTSTLNNYVLTSYLTSNYITANQIYIILSGYVTSSTLSNYYTIQQITSLLSSYYLKTETYSQTEINNLLNNYITLSYLTSNYTNTISLNSLLANKLDTSTYNSFISDLSLKFFSPLSNGNLRKNYFEYADLTSTKYIFFSQNGTNQYQTINFIDNNTLQSSKLVNNSIGQTQLDTTFYDNSLYTYNYWRDSNGALSLAAIAPPSGANDIYIIRCIKTTLLNQINWVSLSTIPANITLPFTISTINSGYSSALTANFKIQQIGNPSTSTGIEYCCENTGDSSFYSSFGFNSSGRYPTTAPNYIQYPNPYCYLFSKRDFNLFCIDNTGNITLRIQCLPAITKIYSETEIIGNLNSSGIIKTDVIQSYSSISLIKFNNNTNHFFNNITNVNLLYLNELYPAVSFIKLNGNLEITNTIKVNNIQGYNVNQIKFNNECDFQNNNIINYNLGSQIMLKTANTSIALKTSTNNTYVQYGVYANDDLGMNLGLYRDVSGVNSCYITMNKNFTFGTNNVILYSINYVAGFSRHTAFFTNLDLNMDVNSTIYTNFLRPNSSVVNCFNLKMNTNLDMNGYTLLNYSGGGGGINTSDTISVNTGAYNYLRKGNITLTNIQIFGMSTNSFNLESNKGESSGISCDCDSDGITLYTPFDVNGVSIQDEDSNNSRIAYINSGGSFITTSTRTRKHSIKEKNNNNVLERIMKLKVKSYGYKYEFNENDNDKKRQRMINKSKKQQLGLILEEVYDIFPNIVDKYDNSLDDKLIDDENIKDKNITFKNKPKIEEIDDIRNQGLDYGKLNLYLLMAFQQYVKENDNSIIKKNYLYYNDRLDEINVRLDNIEYNNLTPENVYRIKNIINTQDEVYKCINDDIKKVKLENDILRDKYIDYVESNIIINNNLKDKVIGLQNEINELKEENIKFKLALKMIMNKLDKKP